MTPATAIRLPVLLSTTTYAGCGPGNKCDLCDQPIVARRIEYDVTDSPTGCFWSRLEVAEGSKADPLVNADPSAQPAASASPLRPPRRPSSRTSSIASAARRLIAYSGLDNSPTRAPAARYST